MNALLNLLWTNVNVQIWTVWLVYFTLMVVWMFVLRDRRRRHMITDTDRWLFRKANSIFLPLYTCTTFIICLLVDVSLLGIAPIVNAAIMTYLHYSYLRKRRHEAIQNAMTTNEAIQPIPMVRATHTTSRRRKHQKPPPKPTIH